MDNDYEDIARYCRNLESELYARTKHISWHAAEDEYDQSVVLVRGEIEVGGETFRYEEKLSAIKIFYGDIPPADAQAMGIISRFMSHLHHAIASPTGRKPPIPTLDRESRHRLRAFLSLCGAAASFIAHMRKLGAVGDWKPMLVPHGTTRWDEWIIKDIDWLDIIGRDSYPAPEYRTITLAPMRLIWMGREYRATLGFSPETQTLCVQDGLSPAQIAHLDSLPCPIKVELGESCDPRRADAKELDRILDEANRYEEE